MASTEKDSILHSILSNKANSEAASNFGGESGTIESAIASTVDCKSDVDLESGEEDDSKRIFHVDRRKISSVAQNNQDEELQNLGLDVYNQEDFEHGKKFILCCNFCDVGHSGTGKNTAT